MSFHCSTLDPSHHFEVGTINRKWTNYEAHGSVYDSGGEICHWGPSALLYLSELWFLIVFFHTHFLSGLCFASKIRTNPSNLNAPSFS